VGAAGECAECRKKRLVGLQRRDTNHAEPSRVPPIVRETLGSSGQLLPPETRAFMEERFGHDFGRVHADERAAESARAVDALAYTVGRNVVFGAGQYTPHTTAGRHLLAHELTHVVQQSGGPARINDLSLDEPEPGANPLVKPPPRPRLWVGRGSRG